MKIKIMILSVEGVTALSFAAVIAFAVSRSTVMGTSMPLSWPLWIAIICTILLFSIRAKADLGDHFMRVGFYVGMFAFFLSFPILSPDEVSTNISGETHDILGWALFLTVVGFEVVYRIVGRSKKNPVPAPLTETSRRQRKWLFVLVLVGIGCWFLSVWDYAIASNAPLSSVLLMMRGVIEGSQTLSGPNYLVLALSSGIFLSATAATLLLCTDTLPIRTAIVCWPAVIACAAVGFLGGSRAGFLYSFVPLAVVVWKKLSKLPFSFMVRAMGTFSAIVLVIVIWSAMTAMRGADIRDFEGGIEEISPVNDVQGAFDIYSTTAEVIEIFPARVPYIYGESIIPLVFGWVPRPLWPEKPYPFGLYMNLVNGESLDARAASLAVGLTGEGYGNFGLFGTFVWGGLLGLACRFGDRYLARFNHQSPMRLVLSGMAAVWVSMIVRGGVPEMFYMGLQVIALPIALAALLSPYRRRIRIRFTESVRVSRQPKPSTSLRT
ncbi:MAG: O-antigen polymerase [Pyrinomonadaceae bacterium]